MNTRARDWFADEAEFRQLCGDAQSQARGESAQDFAAEMVVKAKERGLETFLSPKQLNWLCTLADWDGRSVEAVPMDLEILLEEPDLMTFAINHYWPEIDMSWFVVPAISANESEFSASDKP